MCGKVDILKLINVNVFGEWILPFLGYLVNQKLHEFVWEVVELACL